jgi:type III secretion YscU/HrpY family protein
MSDKTEEPTQKRLNDAKKKGDVAMSRDASGVGGYVAGVALLGATAAAISASFTFLYREAVARAGEQRLEPRSLLELLGASGEGILRASIPLVAAVAVAGVALGFAQVGVVLSAESLKPDLKKLNPLSKLKSWFSPKGMFELLKTFLKLACVLVLGYVAAKGSLTAVLRLGYTDAAATLRIVADLCRHFLLTIAVVFVGLGGADYIFQRKQWKKKLMMSKDEVKREYKEQEGDPHVKGHRKQLHQEMAMQDVGEAVRTADAVTVNPTHLAVALRYDRNTMVAPKVATKGRDALARKIVELAKKHEVPIVRDITLTRALFDLEIDANVPRELYAAVAEVLTFAWKVRQEEGEEPRSAPALPALRRRR